MTSTQQINEDQGGNTIIRPDTKRVPQTHPIYRWCFTIPTSLDQKDHKLLWDTLIIYCKEFYFQVEKGEGGFIHFQGCLSLKHKERFATVKNFLGDKTHLEPCKNWGASVQYCTKIETRVAGFWTVDSSWVKIPSLFTAWHWELRELLTHDASDRWIIWIWEPIGNVGKSLFVKHMAMGYPDDVLAITSGASRDVSFMIKNQKILLFDFPRSQYDKINYQMIETLKGGFITSPKYESKTKIFDSPHIVCFANKPPKVDEMSLDRWLICKIVNGALQMDEENYSEVMTEERMNAALNPPGKAVRTARVKTKDLLPILEEH